jgi:hypothetical protein
MATVVKMPQLGESVVEGTVARWLKQPGEAVTKREPLLEISTDKIDTEVPAPTDGVLLEIVAAAGVTVKAGMPLGYIGAADERNTRDEAGAPAAAPAPVQPTRRPPSHEIAGQPDQVRPAGRDFISPVVARMVAEHAIDLAQIAGTGLGGRITRKDVELHLATQPALADLPAAEEPAPAVELELGDVLAPLTTMRRAIAQHMVMSKQTSPHVTSFFEVDMTAVVRHREANKRHFAEKGIALTYTAYFLAAIVAGLKEVPMVNAGTPTRASSSTGGSTWAWPFRCATGWSCRCCATPTRKTSRGWRGRSTTWWSRRGAATWRPTTCAAAPSPSPTTAPAAASSPRRSSTSRRRAFWASAPSSSGRWCAPPARRCCPVWRMRSSSAPCAI